MASYVAYSTRNQWNAVTLIHVPGMGSVTFETTDYPCATVEQMVIVFNQLYQRT